jgi:hypothetical protein
MNLLRNSSHVSFCSRKGFIPGKGDGMTASWCDTRVMTAAAVRSIILAPRRIAAFAK